MDQAHDRLARYLNVKRDEVMWAIHLAEHICSGTGLPWTVKAR